MRPIFRWILGTGDDSSPSNAQESAHVHLGPYVERLGIVEGEMAGLKIAIESLAESLHKQTAKWNTRARRESEREPSADPYANIDPRVRRLMESRGLIPTDASRDGGT